MTLLILPLSLLAILLLTGLLYSLPGIAISPSRSQTYIQEPLSPIAGLYLDEWHDSKSDPKSLKVVHITPHISQSIHTPIRLTLYWDSKDMAETMTFPTTNSSESVPPARISKRFSIQLPVAPLELKDHASTALVESSRPASPEKIEEIEPGNFLVALAAQERRVLELKEELSKAETDLLKLKRQWAHHEATRKRQEIRRQAEPMRAIKSPVREDPMAQEMKTSSELARRRSILVSTRASQRKVFEGRHARTLSLLSPTSLENRSTFATMGPPSRHAKAESVPMTAMPRLPTQVETHIKNPDPTREDIVATGKQIMGDIKDGLWMFLEDLKQATVGDEAISPTRARQTETGAAPMKAKPVSRTSEDLISMGRADTPANNAEPRTVSTMEIRKPSSPSVTKHTAKHSSPGSKVNDVSDEVSDDGWDNWDSPKPKSITSDSTARSTPRSSLSSDIKRQSATFDQIPWPALQKLSPGNLTRTASNLMKEWEQSLIAQNEVAGPGPQEQ